MVTEETTSYVDWAVLATVYVGVTNAEVDEVQRQATPTKLMVSSSLSLLGGRRLCLVVTALVTSTKLSYVEHG